MYYACSVLPISSSSEEVAAVDTAGPMKLSAIRAASLIPERKAPWTVDG